MKNLFKFALTAVLGIFAVQVSADEITCDPINIGPGQVVTLKFYITNTADDRNSCQFAFDFPAGVQVVGVDYTSTAKKGENVPFILNPERFGDVPTAQSNSSFKFRGKKDIWKHAFVGDFNQELLGNDGWFMSVDITLAEGAAPVNGVVKFCDEPGECVVGGGETEASYSVPADVEAIVSDKFSVKIASSGYSTICSSVDLDVSGVEAFYVTKAEGGQATLSNISGALKAGEGAVIKGTPGEVIQLAVASSAEAPETNFLVGSMKTEQLDEADYGKVFFMSGGKFKKAKKGAYVSAGKAYLKAESALAKGFEELEIVFDDPTAIKNVETETNNGVMYNLNGVRVDNPTKGVYIQNGRKVVVK